MFQHMSMVSAADIGATSNLVMRIGTDARLYDYPEDADISLLLDSRYDSENIEAVKRLLALISKGSDVSNFFPKVVKKLACQTLELKKLVYLYLLHYAEKRPNEALLSINCFQKDLSDPNPLIRACALRTMAGIRLHAIAPISLMALTKCAKDPSPYVRKCAAIALPKLDDLRQEENVSTLEELAGLLLSDHSPSVIGAAAAAYNSVCPHNLSLIGKNFRRLCEALPDVDEWGQIILVEILLRYTVARHGLGQESVMDSLLGPKANHSTDSSTSICKDGDFTTSDACNNKSSLLFLRSYIEGSDEYFSRTDMLNANNDRLDLDSYTTSENKDIKLLLQCTSPLLWSQNSAVILAASSVHWIMAPREDVKKIVKPLLFLLRSCCPSKYVVLCNIQVFSKAMPSLFAPYYEDFFVSSVDSYQIRYLKLQILSLIATDSSISYIILEFQDYIKDIDRRFAADTVAAIGLCAEKIPSVANSCLEGLLALTRDESSVRHSVPIGDSSILVSAIKSIKAVVGQNPTSHEKVIVQLACSLDVINYPSARVLIIWMVGEYCSVGQIIHRSMHIILKYLVQCFTSEEIETKHQILNASMKVALGADKEDMPLFKKILIYLLHLAKYDSNYDVRDRARVMEKLLVSITNSCPEEDISCPSSNKKLSHEVVNYIFSGKLHSESYQSDRYRVYLPGSLSQVVLHAAPGYESLPMPCSLHDSVQAEGRYSDSISAVSDDDSDTLSGSSAEKSDYSSVSSNNSNAVSSGRSDSMDNVQNATETSQLISLDAGDDNTKTGQGVSSLSTDLTELMSKTNLESWLEEQPSFSGPSSSSAQGSGQQASMRISLKEIAVSVRPKVHRLFEPIDGNGLRVDYSFSVDTSKISPLLVCVELSFENLSAETLTKIAIKDIDENMDTASRTFQSQESQLETTTVPKIIPFEEIALLNPYQKVKKNLQVQFHHHLLPIKLVLLCCEKKNPVKLQPDIGYFIKPISLDLKTFKDKEVKLPGMYEYTRSCTFTSHMDKLDHDDNNAVSGDEILAVCRRLASKVLSSANVFFVSVDMPVSVKVDDASGLCLRFSGETLSTLKTCLITITTEGGYSEPLNLHVKVNCEETIFGLNLLNKMVTFLSEK